MSGLESGLSCVIITPARNESENIGRLLSAMAAQTAPPRRWIIVDDGSKDDTAGLVSACLPRFPWIELLRRPETGGRSFAAKVDGFNAGYARAAEIGFDIVGNVDADVSFGPDYLEFLMARFAEDPSLGVAGTPFVEDSGYNTVTDSFEGERHVAGGCQFFRRRCFEEIGGYIANAKGGIDWIAVTTARMKGWTTRSFRERSFHHHRRLGTGESRPLVALFNYGRKDHYLGNHPLWEILRVLYRMAKRPFVIGAMALASGYLYQALLRQERPVGRELIRFHRKEEMGKLREIAGAAFARSEGRR